ncbi:MAG: flagellar basal body L-ring protein FlgH [Alphaproteobacteria bacterium]|nr:flagellar basal body L-ring protein FlgH [Alphaproteobacteria bacterium SS10]
MFERMKRYQSVGRMGAIMGLALMTAACNTVDRLQDVGKAPELAPITDPQQVAGYQPVSLPMPNPDVVEYEPNSLWRSGARAFFRDQRAKRVGDILTVVIEIEDEATLDNNTSRNRQNSEDANLSNLLGYEAALDEILPEAVAPGSLINLGSNSSSSGGGSIEREEDIQLQVAALITQVLPNGNLVIEGRQQVRVNFELRELQVAGVIRPEDITSANEITYEKIAEARLSYGGRGHISDVQQPRYGQQVYDILFPF